jgi:predicted RNA-binding Zn-ribbon protein involved in translation (DUF1610 family)
MTMSPRGRYHLLGWVLWPLGGTVWGLLALYLSPWFAVLLFIWAFAVQRLSNGVRCPNCGKQVNLVADHVRSFSRRRVIIPRECDQCGTRLDAA